MSFAWDVSVLELLSIPLPQITYVKTLQTQPKTINVFLSVFGLKMLPFVDVLGIGEQPGG